MTEQPIKLQGKLGANEFVVFLEQLVRNNVYGVVHLRGDQNHSLNFVDGQIAVDEPAGTKSRMTGRVAMSSILTKLAENEGLRTDYQIEPLIGDPGVHLRRLYDPRALIVGRTPGVSRPESLIKSRPQSGPVKLRQPARLNYSMKSQPNVEQRKTKAAHHLHRTDIEKNVGPVKNLERQTADRGRPVAADDARDQNDDNEDSTRATSTESDVAARRSRRSDAPPKANQAHEPAVASRRFGSNNLIDDGRNSTAPTTTNEPDVPSDVAEISAKAPPDRRSALRRLIQTLSS